MAYRSHGTTSVRSEKLVQRGFGPGNGLLMGLLSAVLSGFSLSACSQGGSECAIRRGELLERIMYRDPPTDQQLDQVIGQGVLVTFRWDGSSSILHSLSVCGELIEFDDDQLFISTVDGRDGACLPESHWNLLLEHMRVSVDPSRPGEIQVSRKWIDSLMRSEILRCDRRED